MPAARAPIDRLVEILKEKGIKSNRDDLSRLLGRRATTPEYIAKISDSDEAAELAEEIAEANSQYFEAGKHRMGVRR